nr:phosphotriesterase [Pedobacter panaciterrae]
MERRQFISLSCFAGFITLYPNFLAIAGESSRAEKGFLMTVNGKIDANAMGFTLTHEHIVTDFKGAEPDTRPEYDNETTASLLLPYLKAAKKSGINTMIECTPAYIGRNVKLLRLLSKASGINIITNTGYYAAVGQKYLPKHAFTETSEELASRWLKEWNDGIDGTDIKPGFIKLGVDNAPLKPIEKKLIKAAAIVHLKSGLKIAIHTGNGAAAREEAEILMAAGVNPEALIWVHAQNDPSGYFHVELARKGCWISLDGINENSDSIVQYRNHIYRLKGEGLLHKLLISHDDGFAVTEVDGKAAFNAFENGNSAPYKTISGMLKPALSELGISSDEFKMITVRNPANAFQMKVCAI